MNQAQAFPNYLQQSDAVRARFDALKARDVVLEVKNLGKTFHSGRREIVASPVSRQQAQS